MFKTKKDWLHYILAGTFQIIFPFVINGIFNQGVNYKFMIIGIVFSSIGVYQLKHNILWIKGLSLSDSKAMGVLFLAIGLCMAILSAFALFH